LATIKKSLASGTHTLFKAGELSEPIKAITIMKLTSDNTQMLVSLSLVEENFSSFFILRFLSLKGGNVFVMDNSNILSYDKLRNDLVITVNAAAQVVVYT